MNRLTFKYKCPTIKEYGHTDIWCDYEFIGYIIPNRSKFRSVNENWNFTSKNFDFDNCRASNRNTLIDMIQEQCYNRQVV